MSLLIIAALLVAVLGVVRMNQLWRIGACLIERLTFGLLLTNTVYVLLYPLSPMEYGWYPLGVLGVAFALYLAVRFLNAKSNQVAQYRGSILTRH